MAKPQYVWRVWKGKKMIAQGAMDTFWGGILMIDSYRQEYGNSITFSLYDPDGVVRWPVEPKPKKKRGQPASPPD